MKFGKFTKRTYYMLGVVCCLLNFAAGLLLIFSTPMGLLIDVAGIGTAAMMLFIITRTSVKMQKTTSFVACIFLIADMFLGTSNDAYAIIGLVCGALAWPIFALGYILGAEKTQDESVKTMANLVILAGVVQGVASFVGVSVEIGACIIMAISAVNGIFIYTLLKLEPKVK